MKISQKQAQLLAREVLAQLKKSNIGVVPETTIAKLETYKEKREQLLSVCKTADDAYAKHAKTLKSIVGNNDRIYESDDVDEIVKKLSEQKIPKLFEIEDKIILKSMFADDGDMDKFIAVIVKEFSKKRQAPTN